jgi:hypothetical protein
MMEESEKVTILSAIKNFLIHRIPYVAGQVCDTVWYRINKLLKPNKVFPIELWGLDSVIAVFAYPKIKAFVEAKRRTYPSCFEEYIPSTEIKYQRFKTEEDYKKAIENGHIGGGVKRWNEVLQEILFAFDWKVNCEDAMFTKRSEEFYKRYGYKNPHAKQKDNLYVRYEYRMTPEQLEKENNECEAYLKSYGGLSPNVWGDEKYSDEECEKKGYVFVKESYGYFDIDYANMIEERARKGFELFGKHFKNLVC